MSTKINECNASFPSSTDTTHSYFPTSKTKNVTSILTGSERSIPIQRLLAFIRKFSDFVLKKFPKQWTDGQFLVQLMLFGKFKHITLAIALTAFHFFRSNLCHSSD